MQDFAAARRNMVDTQLRTYDVTSRRVLDAVEKVPREIFVPQALAALAYSDTPIVAAAGEGVTRQLLPPMVLARLLQALDVKAGDRVLDCAGGSGYGAALAAALGGKVTALEADESMAGLMRDRLAAAGFGQIEVLSGDLALGAPVKAPFDAIVVHGSVEVEPEALLRQLSDGGRLGVIVGAGRAGRAMVMTRNGDVIGRRAVFDAAAPSIPAFRKPATFSL